MSVLRAGRGCRGRGGGGGGGGCKFLLTKTCSWGLKTQFFPYNFFFENVPGVLKHTQLFFWGILGCLRRPTPPPGGREGSENDTLLPMTRDRPKFWNGSTWQSKVIIRKPWRRRKCFLG